MFADSFGRNIRYVRLSVTDRCNFRCVYCMPSGEIDWIAKQELLSFEEIALIARVLADHGVERIRLTGGEPLLRADIVGLISMIRDAGVPDIALTTNAFLLPKYAGALKHAGVTRLNVSIDSLDPDRFAQMTRHGSLQKVIAGIDAARDAGFESIKFNAVVVNGFNDDELIDLVRFAKDRDSVMRFIEFMPIGQHTIWGDGGCLPAAQMRQRLSEHANVVPDPTERGLGPARYYLVDGAPVGFISAVTECFCAGCNRIRISARGAIRACLADDHELSIRDSIRALDDRDDQIKAIENVIRRSLSSKKEIHDFSIQGEGVTRTAMHSIGG